MKRLSLKSFCLVSSLMLLLGLASCVPNADVVGDKGTITLNLDKSEILLANKGGQDKVVVQTNSPEWDFYANAHEDWLKVTKDGNELLISMAENSQLEKRTATLVVFAGGVSKTIQVSQSSADMVFSLSENGVVQIPAQGCTKLLEINSNSKSWTFKSLDASIDWLTIKGGSNGEVLIVEAEPNKSFEPRTAKLEVQLSNGATRLIEFNQLGMAKYILPFDQDWRDYSEYNLIRFEQKRGSVMQQYMFAQVDFWGEVTDGKMIFSTSSAVMPLVIYTTSPTDPKYGQAVIKLMYKDPENKVELDEYTKFLTENDFEEVDSSTPEKTRHFYRKDEKAIIIIDFAPEHAEYALVGYVPIYPQEEAFATFPKLPKGSNGKAYELLNKKDVKLDRVLALEKEVGGVEDGRVMNERDESEVHKILFMEKAVNPEDDDMRLYSFYVSGTNNNFPAEYLGSVNEVLLFIKKYTQAVYLKPKNSGWDITNEFYELLSNEGYRYSGKNGETQIFVKRINPEILEFLHVTYDKQEQILGGNGHVEIGYFQRFNSTLVINNMPKRALPNYYFNANSDGSYSLKSAR